MSQNYAFSLLMLLLWGCEEQPRANWTGLHRDWWARAHTLAILLHGALGKVQQKGFKKWNPAAAEQETTQWQRVTKNWQNSEWPEMKSCRCRAKNDSMTENENLAKFWMTRRVAAAICWAKLRGEGATRFIFITHWSVSFVRAALSKFGANYK